LANVHNVCFLLVAGFRISVIMVASYILTWPGTETDL